MRRRAAPLCWLLCLLLPIGLLGGCAREPQADRSFRFPLSAEPRQLDPQTAADDAARTVLDLLFEGLTALQDGVAVPAAADWSVSEDGTVYVFTLRASSWSNGEPVTADDFLFAYERTCDAATASPHAAALSGVQRVEAPDVHTLQVTLREADPAFPALLATGVWYPCPRAFFEQCRGGWGMEAKNLLQNGAFTLSRWEHDQSLLLRRHEGYHAAKEIAPATVRLVIGADESVSALTDGTLDGCALDSRAVPTDDVTVTEVSDTLCYLWFNNTVSPLHSAAVRGALRDAIEWETIDRLLGDARAVSYVSAAATVRGEAYHSPLAAPILQPDRAAFSKALSALGLSACPPLTLLCADDEDSLRLAQYIVQSWQKNLAAYFTIEQLPADKLVTRLTAGNYQLAIAPATARGDSPADALRLFDGDAADGNWARYGDARWVAAATAAASEAELAAAEEALAAACPAVPLAAVTRRFGLAADVRGVTVTPFTARFDFRHAKR